MDMVMVANMQGGRLITKYYINFPYLDGAVKHGPSMPILADRKGNYIIHISANNEVWLSTGEIVDWSTALKTEEFNRRTFWQTQGHILGSMVGGK